jgi:hypothetical protein
MIGEMIVWGFFSAIGWMGANWTVNKIFPDQPAATIEQKVKDEQDKGHSDTPRCVREPVRARDHCGSEPSRHADLSSGKN